MNSINLLSLENRTEWKAHLDNMPLHLQDIYYTPEYYDIYEKKGEGKAFCFIYKNGRGIALYPFLQMRINDLGYDLENSYYDIQGAYGYNGVLSTTDDQSFINDFYKEFNNFCQSNNIIAEFTRFHPLIKNEKFSRSFLDVSYNRKTIYVDLTRTYDDLHNEYSRSTKGNLKKANQFDLTVQIYKGNYPYLDEFIKMYTETMERVSAEKYLFFNEEYFINTFRNLPVTQFVVFKDEVPIASALCLCKGIYSHIHFEASRTQYLSYRPNNLLFDEIIRKLSQKDYHKLHIGGGNTQSEDDSLLRFKKNFSRQYVEFYIGKKVYNRDVYENVCNQWRMNNPEITEKYNNLLLKYKYQNHTEEINC